MTELPTGIVALSFNPPDDDPPTNSVDEIELRVMLFSVLRDIVGTGEMHLLLPPPARVEDVIDWLAISHPAIRSYGSVIRFAVNHVYVPPFTELNDGDDVALITPVSGG